jgi:hypothetical protein
MSSSQPIAEMEIGVERRKRDERDRQHADVEHGQSSKAFWCPELTLDRGKNSRGIDKCKNKNGIKLSVGGQRMQMFWRCRGKTFRRMMARHFPHDFRGVATSHFRMDGGGAGLEPVTPAI